MNSEENKRIRREITYLSSLNNQYIVRYFQTWVESETNPEIMNEFAEWLEDEYDDEYDDEDPIINPPNTNSNDSFEM